MSSCTPLFPPLAAIIFLFAGAFVMSIVTEAQAVAVLRSLRSTSSPSLHPPSYLVPLMPFPTSLHRRRHVTLASPPRLFSRRCWK
jgi:hypothetical protein